MRSHLNTAAASLARPELQDCPVFLPDKVHRSRRGAGGSAVKGEVLASQSNLRLGLHEDVRLGEVLAGEELRLDGGHPPVLEGLGVGAGGGDALDLGAVDPLGKPAEVAVAEEARAVQSEPRQLAQLGHGALLDGGDNVAAQIHHLKVIETRQGHVTHACDTVS